MNLEEEQEIKKEFQLERVILFSDAVFAIIITIMVIELKLPETIREVKIDSPEMGHAIRDIVLKFTGYLVTFFLVARFWMTHLKIFSFLRDYNSKLLMLNLMFLFCVSLFPFGVTLITGAFRPGSVQYGWGMTAYITIFFFSTLAQSLLVRYLVLNKKTLCVAVDKIEDELRWKSTKFLMASLGFFFGLLILANCLKVEATLYIYIMALFGVVNGVVVRKLYPNEAATDNRPVILKIFSRKKTSPKA